VNSFSTSILWTYFVSHGYIPIIRDLFQLHRLLWKWPCA